jgi:RES domain
MAEFDSLRSYWTFEESVKAAAKCVSDVGPPCGDRAQFVPGEHAEETKRFLGTVRETSRTRRRRIPKGRTYYRAQKGFTWSTAPPSSEEEGVLDVPSAHPLERMVPAADNVGGSRANRRGVPHLYLATHPGAALSEMRPWVGSYVTLARFKMVRDCDVVDCSLNTAVSVLLERVGDDPTEPSAIEKETGVWGDIGFAFAKPTTRNESNLDYIPTQILSEEFKDQGYDGIIYKSLLDEKGLNIALFDVQTAKPTGCCLYQAVSASLRFARQDDLLSCPEEILSEFRRGDAFTIFAPFREGSDAEGGM